MNKRFSSLEYHEIINSLIKEVNEKRFIAELRDEQYLEIESNGRIVEPYISMIRNYFISQEYNVFFMKRFDITPMYHNPTIIGMRLVWW